MSNATNKPNINDLRAFVEVARLENFGLAAEALSVTQGALSRRIQKLEEIVGNKLLHRTSRHVELTAVGVMFLPSATRVISHMDRTLADLNDFIETRSGVVSVASNRTVASTVMPRSVARFRELHPEMKVRILDGTGSAAIESVASGEAEFGVILTDGHDSDLTMEKIIDDPYVLAMHRDHALAEVPEVAWNQLEDEKLLRMAPGSGNGRILHRALVDHGLKLDWAVEAQHVSTIIALIELNQGVSAVPRITIERFNSSQIVTRPLTEPVIYRGIGIVTEPKRPLSPVAHALQDIICDELQRFGGKGVVVAA